MEISGFELLNKESIGLRASLASPKTAHLLELQDDGVDLECLKSQPLSVEDIQEKEE